MEGGIKMAGKGIVLEAGKGWAVVLFPNGEYKKIRTKKPLQPGEIYQLNSNSSLRYAVAAAAIFLIILLGTLDLFSVVAYAHVTPGIELSLNRWNRVVYTEVINDEGKALLQGLDLKGKKIETAVEIVATKSFHTNCINEQGEEQLIMSVTVEAGNKQNVERLQQKLLSRIDAAVQKVIEQNSGGNSKFQVIKKKNKLLVLPVKQEQVSAPGSDNDEDLTNTGTDSSAGNGSNGRNENSLNVREKWIEDESNKMSENLPTGDCEQTEKGIWTEHGDKTADQIQEEGKQNFPQSLKSKLETQTGGKTKPVFIDVGDKKQKR
jgi:flagellar basal body-associated protein FliL